ncbi:MAG: DUF695 domain-containing protein [Muribaculaceae bacterium]|nr:DUF695 domain-containing protein [Muribaculaceae bacterium]
MDKNRWWTTPMEGSTGKTLIVTGRDNLDKQRESGKYKFLIRVGWDYNSLPDGFPDKIDAELMGRVQDALQETFDKDTAALMVAIQTGEGSRDWLFYTTSLHIFNKIFNRALEDIEETVPFKIEAQSDPDWEEYLDLKRETYIPPSDEE